MHRRSRQTDALWALAAVLIVACGTANAQVKPFKITGGGIGPEGLPLPGQPSRPHWAIGQATHLGRYYGEGSVHTDTNNLNIDPVTGIITGEFGSGDPFVFTAADGDELVCYYGRVDHGASRPGTFTLIPLGGGVYQAFWIAEFIPVSDDSTGKFAGVTGGWVMYAQSEPFVLGASDPIAYSWEGEGSLTFAK